MFLKKLCFCLFILTQVLEIQSQSGPDPWEQSRSKTPGIRDKGNLSPRRKDRTENKLGISEWFFKKIVTIVLIGGQRKVDKDGSVDISLQMRFEPKQWEVLLKSMTFDSPLSEDMLRRTVRYIQKSIYKPTIVEKNSMADYLFLWSDYIENYLTEYKTHITWTLGGLGAAGALLWMCSRLSHIQVLIIIFCIFYGYENVISYKEAEKKEMEIFTAAVNSCNKWYKFWKSPCEVPSPDPLIFLKHMYPPKILGRMFSSSLAEPFVAFNEVIDVNVNRLTDGLYYPFNKLSYAVIVVIINISMIYFFFMIICNWVFNITFNINFIGGLFGIAIPQRHRNLFSGIKHNDPARPDPVPVRNNEEPETINPPIRNNEEAERIYPSTLNNIMNMFTLILRIIIAQNRADLNQMPTTSNPMLSSSSSSNVPFRRPVALSRQDAALSSGRSRSRNRSGATSSQSSRSATPDNAKRCWYHRKFGKKASKCTSPCNWKSENSESSQ